MKEVFWYTNNSKKWMVYILQVLYVEFICRIYPRQYSKIASIEIAKIGGKQISIPAIAPELNPIENPLNLVEQKLGQVVATRKTGGNSGNQ